MRFLSLFSGIGGFELGLERAGMECVGQVEWNKYCQAVLKKHWPHVKRMEDIKKVSYWNLAYNDGKDYIIHICETQNKDAQTLKILRLHINRNSKEELGEIVRHVEPPFPCLPLYQTGDGVFVLLSADMGLCEEIMRQIPVGANGCSEIKTQTGKADLQQKGKGDIKKRRCRNGDEGSLRETIISVKFVDIYLEQKTLLTHTISKNGLNIPPSDSISQTELLYAENAITESTMRIDLICGGVPCQPASSAGKRRGEEDDRWLWPEAFRILHEVKPTWCLFENVYGLVSLKQGMVLKSLLTDLESRGYEVQPFIIPACAINAPHRRDRVWIVARDSEGAGAAPLEKVFEGANADANGVYQDVADSHSEGLPNIKGCGPDAWLDGDRAVGSAGWWDTEPNVGRVANGVPRRVDRLKCLGNAVVPGIVEEIGKAIMAIDGAGDGMEAIGAILRRGG